MPQPQAQVVANCPNPKCNKPIPIDHPYSWCAECGNELPDSILSRLPKIQKSRAQAQAFKAPVDPLETPLTRRYKDAYLVARAVNGFGGLIKGIGVFLGIITVLASMLIIANDDRATPVGIIGILLGLFVGLLLYFFGVLVSAQGQILKASLDTAVNTSPLLTNEERAKMMSL